jgi:hypothetical protein
MQRLVSNVSTENWDKKSAAELMMKRKGDVISKYCGAQRGGGGGAG